MLTIKNLHHIVILSCLICSRYVTAASSKFQLLQDISHACAALGVTADDSLSAINKKYRILAHKYHPDRASDEIKKQQDEPFKKINNAHALLSDENNFKLINEALSATAHPSGHTRTAPLPKQPRSDGSSWSWRDYTEPLSKQQDKTDKQITRELRDTVHKACILLGIYHTNSKDSIYAKYAWHMERFKYRPLSLNDQIAEAMAMHALKIVEAHYDMVWSIPCSTLPALRSLRPDVQHSFSSDFMNAAVHIIQDKKSVWQPSLNYMRCYHWRGLMETIRYGSVDEVNQYLVPNPYLFTLNVQFEKNPDLQDLEKRSRLALEAVHLSVNDLVNMDDGSTDALTEAYRLRQDPPRVSYKGMTPEVRAERIYNLLVYWGAIAHFYFKKPRIGSI